MIEDSDQFEDEMITDSRGRSNGDDNIFSGTGRMSINSRRQKNKNSMSRMNLQKAEQKLDDLTVTAKNHLDDLQQKDNDYKLIKQKIDAAKRDLMQCQGLLEVIEEKDSDENDTPLEDQGIDEAKENLKVYTELIERAAINFEDVHTSLKQDDERTNKLMRQLQDLKMKIQDKKLKKVQEQFKQNAITHELIPPPNLLELQDLRKKINRIMMNAMDDAQWLENSIKVIEKCKKKTGKLQDKVEEMSPSIHKFKRRPQTKLMEFMMEYNWNLGEQADKLKDRQNSLGKFADKNQDIRMEQGVEVGNEFAQQQSVLDEYKKTVKILKEQHKGVMVEQKDDDKIITEEGPVYELEKIMDEISDLLQNTIQKINDNNLNLRTQRLGCFLTLDEINSTRDLIVDTVQIPIPSKPNIQDLTTKPYEDEKDVSDNEDDGDENEDNTKGAHVMLNEMRIKQRDIYKMQHAKKLAGLTNYDDTVKLHLALNRIRATLGSVSPLHYSVISDDYLKPVIKQGRAELNKLLKHYQSFKPIKSDVAIDDEVSNYDMQMVQDLAADYHKENMDSDKQFVVDENIKIIQSKLKELDKLENGDLKCIELKHLKELYESFLDHNLPQPLPLHGAQYQNERITETKKKDYKTEPVKKYVGLNDIDDDGNKENLQQMIQDIDKELFHQRAYVMPHAFNMIYQDGIIFDAFPGDFKKLKKYTMSQRGVTDDIVGMDEDELLLAEKEFAEMTRNKQVKLIKELMVLEWEYAGWINDREDYVTQKALYKDEALYYKRLFVLPLDDFHLEKERQNLFEDQLTNQFRKYRKGIYDKKREEEDKIKKMEEEKLRMKMAADDSSDDSFDNMGMRSKYDDRKQQELDNMGLRSKYDDRKQQELDDMGLRSKYDDRKDQSDDSLGSGGMRLKKNGDKNKKDTRDNDENEEEAEAAPFKEERTMIDNEDKRGQSDQVELNKKKKDKFIMENSQQHKPHVIGMANDIDNDSNTSNDAEYNRQSGKHKVKPSKHRHKDENKEKDGGGDEEYESAEIEYMSSDPEYLSVDDEQNEQRKPYQIKDNKHKPDEEERPGAHGYGMEVGYGHPQQQQNPGQQQPYLYDLQPGDFNDIHHSPNPEMLQQNPMISSYIQQQVALMNAAQLKQMEEKNPYQSQKISMQQQQQWNEVEGSTDTEDREDDEESRRGYNQDEQEPDGEDVEDEEDEDEYMLEKLREILTNHQWLDEDDADAEGILNQIDNLCRNADEWGNKYTSEHKRNKRMKNEIEKLENTLQDIEDEHERLKQEYLKMRQENEELVKKLRDYRRQRRNDPTPTGGGPDDGDYMEVEERDILNQLQDDLLQLRQDINDSQQSAKAEYKNCKVRLESMCEPLGDLANDFESEVLKDALNKLNKSVNDINNLQDMELYQHGPLANIVESNIDDIDDLLNGLANIQKGKKQQKQQNKNGQTEPVPVCGTAAETDYKFPELVYDGDDGKNNDNNDIQPGTDTKGYDRDVERVCFMISMLFCMCGFPR